MTGKKTEVSTDLRPPKNAEAGDENVAAAGIGRPTPVSQRQRLRNRHRPHAPSAKCEDRAHGPAFVSYWRRKSDFCQRHLRHRAALQLGPRRRPPLWLRPRQRQFFRFRRDGPVKELEAKLVATFLVLVDDYAHVS